MRQGIFHIRRGEDIMSARDYPIKHVFTEKDKQPPKEHLLLPHRTGEYFETLLKQLPDGVLLTDPKGLILRANRSFYSMFGYSKDDLNGKYIQELMPDSVIQKEITSNFEKLAQGKLGKVEASRKRKDGSSIDVMIHGGPIMDGEKMEAVFIIYMNITARKEMERSLIKSQERFSLAMDATEDGLWDWDLRTDNVYYSPKYEIMLGYTPGEINSRIESWVDLIHPEDRDKVLDTNHFHIDGSPAGFQIEYRMKRKDGGWQWVQGRGKVVERDKDGSPLRMIGTHRDISERIENEQILKENESRFRSLFENSPVSLWEEDWRDIRQYISELGSKGISDYASHFNNNPEAVMNCINLIRVLKINKATADLLEIPEENMASLKNLRDMISERSFPVFRDEFISVAMGKTHFKAEITFHTSKGTERTASLHMDVPPGYENDLSKVFISLSDITDHKKAEQELLQEKLNWELLFQNSPQGIVITDEEEKILRTNLKFSKMFGFSEEELRGSHVNEIVSGPNSSRKESAAISEKLRKGQPIDVKTVRHTRDGIPLNIDLLVIPMENYYGKKIYYGIYKDITENVRISTALQQSEQFNASLLENARHPIVVYGPDLSIRYVNPAFTELTGFEEQELLGTEPPYPWWPAEHPEHMDKLRSMMKSGSMKHEMLFYRKDKIPFWVELSPKAVKDEEKVKYYISNWVDITERKMTNQELEKEKRFWQQLFENAPEGIVLIDEQDRILRANSSFCNIFGYSREEVLGRMVDDVVARNQDYYEQAQHYSENARKGRLVSLDSVRFKKDGTPVQVSIMGVPLTLQDGTTYGYGIYRDITQRKKTEEALEKEHNYLLNLFEGAPEGIVLCDKDQKVIQGNMEFCRMFGYDPREVVGRFLDELVTADAVKAKEAVSITERVKRGEFMQMETIRNRKDGSEIPVSILGVPFHVGNDYAIYAIYRDVTTQKKAEEELKRSYRQLEKAMGGTVNTMAKVVETRDPYTAGHQMRVAELASAIAREMGLEPERIEAIRFAAMIHDIGKISIPTEILSKPGKLSDLEFRLIQNHPEAAWEILKGIDFPWPIAKTVRQHHERLDGTGYPSGLKGNDILLEARILAVADVVEAMSSDRPYRPGLGIEKALQEIKEKKETFFDPRVVEICLELFHKKDFRFPG